MTDHPTQGDLVEISLDECWDLVRSRTIGRFAANRPAGAPLVVPVNYLVDGTQIVFRSGGGTKLRSVSDGPVAIQVDDIDPVRHIGWSVLLEGMARWLYEEQDDARVETWAPGDRPYVIRLKVTRITGRRIDLPQLDTDSRGYR